MLAGQKGVTFVAPDGKNSHRWRSVSSVSIRVHPWLLIPASEFGLRKALQFAPLGSGTWPGLRR
jgi:hypothetical protein